MLRVKVLVLAIAAATMLTGGAAMPAGAQQLQQSNQSNQQQQVAGNNTGNIIQQQSNNTNDECGWYWDDWYGWQYWCWSAHVGWYLPDGCSQQVQQRNSGPTSGNQGNYSNQSCTVVSG